jgi:anthraniloyl-CoA monooxygenase
MTETMATGAGGGARQAGIASDDQLVAWRRIVEFVHAGSPAAIGAQLACYGGDRVAAHELVEAAQRAGFAGFDLLQLQLATGDLARALSEDRTAAVIDAIAAVRDAWPAARPLAVRLVAGVLSGDAAVALAAALKGRGVGLVAVAAVAEAGDRERSQDLGRLGAAPLADRIRNEAGVATMIEGAVQSSADVDAVIAAGRCDLVALDRALVLDPGFVHRAADAVGFTIGARS